MMIISPRDSPCFLHFWGLSHLFWVEESLRMSSTMQVWWRPWLRGCTCQSDAPSIFTLAHISNLSEHKPHNRLAQRHILEPGYDSRDDYSVPPFAGTSSSNSNSGQRLFWDEGDARGRIHPQREKKFIEMVAMPFWWETCMSVSYTHLTLPTICSV